MKTLTALIVDDDGYARDLLRSLLHELNCNTVAAAANGEEALRYLRGHRVDILFLDIEMPGIDGLETLRQILQQRWTMSNRPSTTVPRALLSSPTPAPRSGTRSRNSGSSNRPHPQPTLTLPQKTALRKTIHRTTYPENKVYRCISALRLKFTESTVQPGRISRHPGAGRVDGSRCNNRNS